MRLANGVQNGPQPTEKGTKVMLAQMQVASEGLPLPSAEASGDELFRLGLLYSTGQGGAPLDYVSAHMLFNLAAMRGSMEAKVYRKELSEEMASDEVAEAQRQAREWLAHG
jgi:TPR repeat protein